MAQANGSALYSRWPTWSVTSHTWTTELSREHWKSPKESSTSCIDRYILICLVVLFLYPCKLMLMHSDIWKCLDCYVLVVNLFLKEECMRYKILHYFSRILFFSFLVKSCFKCFVYATTNPAQATNLLIEGFSTKFCNTKVILICVLKLMETLKME